MNAQPNYLRSVPNDQRFDPPGDETFVGPNGAMAAEIHNMTGLPDDMGPQSRVLGSRVPVTTFDHRLPPPRHAEVEALWFSLCKNGFAPTAVVAVPPLSGEVARAFAMDIARTGAALTQTNVHVVNTVGRFPAETVQALEELPSLQGEPTFVVTEAPSVNTAGLPVFRTTARTLLIVGKGHSEVAEADALIEEIGLERIAGSVVIEPPPVSRRKKKGRRSAKS